MLILITILTSVFPGALAWWWGRNLIKQAEHPLSPERYVAYWSRIFITGLICTLLLNAVFIFNNVGLYKPTRLTFGPLFVLMVLLTLAGGFPSRKVLLKESWNFLNYLEFKLRFFLAFSGFSVLLFFTPFIIARVDSHLLLIIGLLAVLLYGRLLININGIRLILGARNITDDNLINRLNLVSDRATAARPYLLTLDLSGGTFANAFAIPALPKPAVLFTQTLLDALSPEEIDAIYAHELGHLEHMDARFVRKKLLLTITLITLALFIVPIIETWAGLTLSAIQSLFIGLILLIIHIKVLGHKQEHEADSDARAVQLCGNAQALQSALERLHDINHVPHRWNQKTENAATHPSLANRKRLINKAAESAPSRLDAPLIIPGAENGKWVIFESSQMHWLEGVPENNPPDCNELMANATHKTTLAYSEFCELFLKPSSKGHALLTGTDGKGRQYKLEVSGDNIKQAETALRSADQHIVQSIPGNIAKPTSLYLYSIVVLGLMYLLRDNNPLLTVAAVILSLLRPSYLALTVLGALAMGECISFLMQRPLENMQEFIPAIIGIQLGLVMVFVAIKKVKNHPALPDNNFWFFAGLLGFTVLIGLGHFLLISSGLNTLRLHAMAINSPALPVALLGLAAALFIKLNLRQWWLSAGIALFAGLVFFLQSPYFGTEIANDPFARRPNHLPQTNVTLTPIKQKALASNAQVTQVSPSGNRFIYSTFTPGEDTDSGYNLKHVLSGFDGKSQTLSVQHSVFIDDDNLLAVAQTKQEKSVQLWRWNQSSWEKTTLTWPIPKNFVPTRIYWEQTQKTWQLEGIDNTNELMTMTGKLENKQTKVNKVAQVAYSYPAVWLGSQYFRTSIESKDTYANNSFNLLRHFINIPMESYLGLWLSDSENSQKIATTSAGTKDCLKKLEENPKTLNLYCLYGRRNNSNSYLGIFDINKRQLTASVPVDSIYYSPAGQVNDFLILYYYNKILAINPRRKISLKLNINNNQQPVRVISVSDGIMAVQVNPSSPGKEGTLQLFDLTKILDF